MACNCSKELCKAIREDFDSSGFDIANSVTLCCEGLGINKETGELTNIVSSPFEIIYTHDTKSGKKLKRKKTVNIVQAFCPFCGKKFKEESEVTNE